MALRIARQPGEVLLIKQNGRTVMRIKVDTIKQGGHGKAFLVIEAPQSIDVVREELVTKDAPRLQ
ncbi:MAG: carbon storage regulator [Dehalococcoidia bacterium]